MKTLSASTARAILIATLLLVAPSRLLPQFANGSITGVVKDATGAVIPAAIVTVTEQQTGSAVKVTSQADGSYTAPNLAPAFYRVAAEVAGFKRLVVEGRLHQPALAPPRLTLAQQQTVAHHP